MKPRRKLAVLIVLIVLVLACVGVLWEVSRSRTFQFFGVLVSRVSTTQKMVALTFDDGPTPQGTEQILSILNERNVRATFFVTGAELEKDPIDGKRIVTAGHELGNHSYSHERMLLITPSYVRSEIENTDKLIRDTGYEREILFRPPYGKKLFALPFYLWRNNRKSITWDVEPESFPEVGSSAERIAQYVTSNTRPGSIIILHVMYPSRIESMKSVKLIIDGLRTQGYEFTTVSDLLKLNQK